MYIYIYVHVHLCARRLDTPLWASAFYREAAASSIAQKKTYFS